MRMQYFDWLIVILPIAILIGVSIYSSKFVRGVVDFLAAGRVAGRYVISVGDMAGMLSVLMLVAAVEQNYQTGFSVGFWGAIASPIAIFISLTGYCLYRWRETRCLSLGQFLELRYGSKFFRIFCATLRTIAEMVTNSISPAVAANFFIYFLGLPHKIMICGVSLPCYGIIIVMCLALAMIFLWPSGRISLLITDSIQGMLCYPIFMIVVGYVILHFSWGDDIAPTMWNRVEGESFINPFDISKLRDFNLFAIVVTLCGSIISRADWFGNDTSGAAKTAHEQKMAGILGTWRNGFSTMMMLLLAVLVITFLNSPNFLTENRFGITSSEVRCSLTSKILENVVPEPEKRQQIIHEVAQVHNREIMQYRNYQSDIAGAPEKLAKARAPQHPEKYHSQMQKAVKLQQEGKTIPVEIRATMIQPPLSQTGCPDMDYLNAIRKGLGNTPEGRQQFQEVRSLYNQMLMPTVVGKLFPSGLLGLFCLLMIMLLISTDDSRIFNASSTIVQDVILPFFKEHLDGRTHIWLLRFVSLGVALFFLIVSLFFAQLDYILMFYTIMCAVWSGGAGPIMIFGLYSRFGNLWGAWAALFFGSGTSLAGLILQRNWALRVYPFLERMHWVDAFDFFLRKISAPFSPWIAWSMDAVKFPINSYEIYFISMIFSICAYILFSLLANYLNKINPAWGIPVYDLDRLLHRGIYAKHPGIRSRKFQFSFSRVINAVVGINPAYSIGDKILTWGVFIYSFIWGFLILFVGIIVWNAVSPWPDSWWTIEFFIVSIFVSGIIGAISTIWFLIGGTHDIIDLFKSLAKRINDPNDNGQVFRKY